MGDHGEVAENPVFGKFGSPLDWDSASGVPWVNARAFVVTYLMKPKRRSKYL
jgi:hypothetical protein